MAGWFGKNLPGWTRKGEYSRYGELAGHVAWADRTARRLARTLAMAMARYGPALERRQAVLFRLVDIGARLFALSAACVHATALLEAKPDDPSPVRLADLYGRRARREVEELFERVFDDTDPVAYGLARDLLDGGFRWLEEGIFAPPAPDGFVRGAGPPATGAEGRDKSPTPEGATA